LIGGLSLFLYVAGYILTHSCVKLERKMEVISNMFYFSPVKQELKDKNTKKKGKVEKTPDMEVAAEKKDLRKKLKSPSCFSYICCRCSKYYDSLE